EQDSDGQAHHIQLTYDRRELMADPPPEFDLGADEATKTFAVATAQGRPGDGDQPIQIGLKTDEGATVGDPATVQIIDTPAAPYTIVPPQNVSRGYPIQFQVDKSDGKERTQHDFDVRQGKDRIYPDGMLHPLVFNPGERSKTLTLAPSFYDDCGQPVTFE